MKLLASPLYAKAFIFFHLYLFILKRIVHQHLFIFERKRDTNLLRVEEVVTSEKHIDTFDLGLLV